VWENVGTGVENNTREWSIDPFLGRVQQRAFDAIFTTRCRDVAHMARRVRTSVGGSRRAVERVLVWG